jgi:peptidylprolyl isomerase/FKBP-type peptidyl-prolyl cis-trans isomerase FklB
MRATVLILMGALAVAGCQRHGGSVMGEAASGGATNATAAAPTGEAAAFLADNARQPGVRTLPSGLQYRIIHSGPATGLHPREGDEVRVNYEGKLVTGEVFDSTYERGHPEAMPVNGLVRGWILALSLMRPGDEWEVWVPPALGYADREAGPIPPNSVLIFRLELIDVLPAPERVGRG